MFCRDEQANQAVQLREWLEDVRSDRNRLEVRLMAGSGTAAQDTRSDLEDCVLRLGREKSVLQAAVSALAVEQRQNHEYLVCFHGIACMPELLRDLLALPIHMLAVCFSVSLTRCTNQQSTCWIGVWMYVVLAYSGITDCVGGQSALPGGTTTAPTFISAAA